jgi:hypothetical protein
LWGFNGRVPGDDDRNAVPVSRPSGSVERPRREAAVVDAGVALRMPRQN